MRKIMLRTAGMAQLGRADLRAAAGAAALWMIVWVAMFSRCAGCRQRNSASQVPPFRAVKPVESESSRARTTFCVLLAATKVSGHS